MSYSDNLEKISQNLGESFINHQIDFETIEYGGLMHLFFIKPESEEALFDDWEGITSWIAGNFQVQLNTEYETWNIYLFFLFEATIDPKLKYRIENDTFSSRKIIIEKLKDYEVIKKEHVINNDLKVGEKQCELATDILIKNPIIEDVLKQKMLKKKKRTMEAVNSFDQLVEALRKKDDEV